MNTDKEGIALATAVVQSQERLHYHLKQRNRQDPCKKCMLRLTTINVETLTFFMFKYNRYFHNSKIITFHFMIHYTELCSKDSNVL